MEIQRRQLVNPVSKERITFLQTGAETGGQSFLFEVAAPPDTVAPPAHVHVGEDERIDVLEGEITAVVGGRRQVMRAGDTCVWGAGVAHT